MIATINLSVQNGVFTATITTDHTIVESRLINAYGEPKIDTGGTIPYTKADTTSSTFTIGTAGSQFVYIVSSAPFSFSLNISTDPEAAQKVAGWGVEMKNRIAAAMTTLRTKPAVGLPSEAFYEV